ncbi:MAG TPA: transketolase [Solirubrobacterales bacterium]|nr:transketolase [Solirubrobacterales bacterium]
MSNLSDTGAPDRELVERLEDRAHFIRRETIRLISIAKVGHYASAFSCAEILSTLYYGVMDLRPGEPAWADRDRFILGKGHAAVGLYPILADLDFLPRAVLNGYTNLGNPLGDHPDRTRVPGVDFSSGSIGHALSAGLGMALAGRLAGRGYNSFVLLGDGEQNEGQVWEAAMSAAHHQAGRTIAIIDRNGYCLDGPVDEVMSIEPLADKWRAFGWDVHEVDGHDVSALYAVLRRLSDRERPTQPAVVIANTVKGKGVTFMENDFGWHLGYLNADDEREAIREIDRSARRI